ncbi:MAG: MotA/TolQ/ExbB proton channel family protein [Syntrophorhabdaceae bacterium PtaU1.Bin034]|nr:MAG: MotA/TolQ/ExbB proton channel family protein [Syntrophorhabdaceae bacterium PtaU1.Bin034]
MKILAGLESFLYIISSVMLFPVVAGLVLLTLWIVVYSGMFIREWVDRRQGRYVAQSRYRRALEKEMGAPREKANQDIALERLLQTNELRLVKSLDMIRFAIRVGPALGLMGTLIPMGISLSSLAQGNLPKMAGSMVTAFTTVVVGLACSVAAYLMSLVKEKWVRADMREMEYATELMLRSREGRHLTVVDEEEVDHELS